MFRLSSLSLSAASLALIGSLGAPATIMGMGLALAAPAVANAGASTFIRRVRIKKRRTGSAYRATARIESGTDGAAVAEVRSEIRFTAPDGMPGPVVEAVLDPEETTTLGMNNPTFEGGPGAATNVLNMTVEGGSCGGTELDIAVERVADQPVEFTVCESGSGAVTGRAWYNSRGEERLSLTVPTDRQTRSALYGRILIKGEPIEFERTVYSGDFGTEDEAALDGYTFEQTVTAVDAGGAVLARETVRGVVGDDGVETARADAVIIGNRNKLKERPRRNYRGVHVTQTSPDGPPTEALALDVVYEPVEGEGDAAPFIPPVTLGAPLRQSVGYTLVAGGGAEPGAVLDGAVCGAPFSVTLGGLDADMDGFIDDMSGTPVEGRDLKVKAAPREDGTVRLRVRGPYAAFAGCDVQDLDLAGASLLQDWAVNAIWEAEIAADPRTFDGATYRRTLTLSGTGGTALDSQVERVVLDAPDTTTSTPQGHVVIGNRNRLKQKPRRNYKGVSRTVSGNDAPLGAALALDLAVSYAGPDGPRVVGTGTSTTPATSVHEFEAPNTEGGRLRPSPGWCDLNFDLSYMAGQTAELEGGVTASVTERGNGNLRLTLKGPGEAFPGQCADAGPLLLNDAPAYGMGVTHNWATEVTGLPQDLDPGTPLRLETVLRNAATGEALTRGVDTLTANDAPQTGPQLGAIELRYDRGIQAVFDGRLGAVAQGFAETEIPALDAVFATGTGQDLPSAQSSEVCHLYNQPEVFFIEPDNVVDMEYLVEVSAVGLEGNDLAYAEIGVVGQEVVPADGSDIIGTQLTGEEVELLALLSQNDDGETFELTVGLCGDIPLLQRMAVFLTPQDGGSEADPADFNLDFTDKLLVLEQAIPAIPSGLPGDTLVGTVQIGADGDIWSCETDAAEIQRTGQMCGTTSHLRPPEPYRGKGTRYVGEIIRRKAGKAAAK